MNKMFPFLVLFSTICFAQTDSSLAHHRAAHLRRGINLSEWFAQVYDPKGYTKEHLASWVTEWNWMEDREFDPHRAFREMQAYQDKEAFLQELVSRRTL